MLLKLVARCLHRCGQWPHSIVAQVAASLANCFSISSLLRQVKIDNAAFSARSYVALSGPFGFKTLARRMESEHFSQLMAVYERWLIITNDPGHVIKYIQYLMARGIKSLISGIDTPKSIAL
jgi:hypothetical protein